MTSCVSAEPLMRQNVSQRCNFTLLLTVFVYSNTDGNCPEVYLETFEVVTLTNVETSPSQTAGT